MLLEALSRFNEFFTLFFVFPALLLLGIYLTWRLKFIQITKMGAAFSLVFKKGEKGEEGDITHYQAVSTVLASNFGTGNISGMAVALSVGGPGALVWMWVMCFLGSIVQFANCLLGVKYRKKLESGEHVGGPMYYFCEGMGLKSLGTAYSLIVIIAAFAVGNFVQVNSLALPLAEMGVPGWVVGGVLSVLVALVVVGGMGRVAKVSAAVVPVMGLLYFGAALVVLVLFADQLPTAIVTLFRSAFGGSSLLGGAMGFTVLKSLTTGFDRAIFATDAGTGTAPMLQSGAKTKDPVIDGIVSLVAPFMVMIVCSVTALVLLVSGVPAEPGLQSTGLILHAFHKGIGQTFGSTIVITALVLFGYTTILTWATCLDRAIIYLWGPSWTRPFRLLYILVVPLGALMRVDLVWILADLSLTSLLLLNLIGVTSLSREVIADSNRFFRPELETSAL
ncbi:MAG: Amino-acid carrier protein AlsT [Chlamydiae bacterium]|nr:Amino-acid carrier protein AlsT [Chlamydiota bacterium]